MKKIESKKVSINKMAILNGSIIIITIIVGFFLIYVPFINQNKSLRKQILHERDKNLLTGNIRAMGKHLNTYEKKVSRGASVSFLLGEISEMASEDKVDISSIKPNAQEEYGSYIKLYIALDGISGFNQLGRFISRIESSERFFRIESIDIKRLDTDEKFEPEHSRYKPFDVKSRIVISAVILKE